MKQSSANIEKMYCVILMLFMICTLVAPVSYQIYKIGLLLFLMIGVVYSMVQKKCYIPIKIVRVMLIYILYNVISIVIGFVLSAPGALRVSTVEVLWPILYLLLFLAFPTEDTLKYIFRGIIIGIGIVILMDLLFLMAGYGYISLSLVIFTKLDFGYIFDPYNRAFSSSHMVAYLYGIPFLTGMVISEKNKKYRLGYLVLLFFACVNVALSGRRALFLVILFLPFFGFAIYKYVLNNGFMKYRVNDRVSKKRLVITLIIVSVLIGCIAVMWEQMTGFLERIWQTLSEGFQFGNANNGDAYARGNQFQALMKGWMEHPFLGNGAGSYTEDCIRSFTAPWSYELSYCALLFQKGIVGICTFISLIICAFKESKKKIQENRFFFKYSYPALLGMTGILIGHATNPYLGKFSCVWYLFFAVVISGIKMKNDNN